MKLTQGVKLRERNLLGGKGFTFVARLENSPPTAAQVRVKPETVFYPWQQKEQERQLEAKRAQYRQKYEAYAAQVLNNSAFRGAARQEVDIALKADEILPAEAQREAERLRARGKAAIFEENAKAAALVNDLLSQVWQETGKDVSEVFLIQQLETILQEAVKIPRKLHLNNVNIVDNGDGKSLSTLVKVYPEIVGQFLNSVNQILGVDVVGTLVQQPKN